MHYSKTIKFALLTFFCISASLSWASGRNLSARLEGFQEVPSILSPGSGFFRARIRRDLSIDFVLRVDDLVGTFTAAHIHFAQEGVNGGIMVTLCGGPAPAVVTSCSEEVRGTISPDFIRDVSAQGVLPSDFDALVETLRSGNTYINVHSTAFPSGELRGQVR